MSDIPLGQEFFAELSAFVANARKEGFSFKPSQIVKDKDYCNDIINTLSNNGSEALTASAISIISKCSNLSVEHHLS